ncbi:Fic family protein [Intrasporangium sp.]|uniref:Fic family protein n=1 Tax=Intrasporangium sp. TaxID=1925024 RepID=UPI0029396242|nr:Fic family protein [Intrasporangium sp.]MDV3221284.1 Fic family protein [Intrasporangium sp.]
MRWPAIGTREHPWTARPEGLAATSRRARRSIPATYHAAVVPMIAAVPVDLTGDLAADLDDAARLLTAFDAGGAGEVAPFASILLRSESAASSHIENLTSSARALAEAAIGAGDRSNALTILANVRTMQAAMELAGDLGEASILAMHRALMTGRPGLHPGQWRTEQVWVGGGGLHPGDAEFVPPVAADVPALMADLVAFLVRDDVPPLALGAVAHAQFETIHPFADGNGRTGRALLHACLLNTGVISRVTVPISAGLLAAKGRYFGALTSYRAGDAEPILRCVADAARAGVAVGEQLVRRLRDVRAGWDGRVDARVDSVVWRIADVLLRQPVVTARLVTTELQVSAPTAQAALARLVAAGVLVESTGWKRNRVYRSPEVLEALDGYAEGLGRRSR